MKDVTKATDRSGDQHSIFIIQRKGLASTTRLVIGILEFLQRNQAAVQSRMERRDWFPKMKLNKKLVDEKYQRQLRTRSREYR